MHEGVAAESEGVVVDGCDGRAACCADVCKADARFGVGADAAEVHVVQGRLDGFVHCWAQAGFLGAVA